MNQIQRLINRLKSIILRPQPHGWLCDCGNFERSR
jgi:hypothetical protein